MVKAVLAPKSIEDQFIRRVWQGHDKGLVNKVLTPVGTDILRVCLCMDGRSGASNHNSVYAGLKQLFEWWGEHVQIEINLFTFLCAAGSLQEAEMLQLLNEANLFYFCGIQEMSEGLRRPFKFRSPLVERLRARIQYDQMSFFGVCGGAMMAGATTWYGCPGLDLFDGITVCYDANISGPAAKVKTNFENRVMQMTTGCALAVVMTYDHMAASSFITIKNGQQ